MRNTQEHPAISWQSTRPSAAADSASRVTTCLHSHLASGGRSMEKPADIEELSPPSQRARAQGTPNAIHKQAHTTLLLPRGANLLTIRPSLSPQDVHCVSRSTPRPRTNLPLRNRQRANIRDAVGRWHDPWCTHGWLPLPHELCVFKLVLSPVPQALLAPTCSLFAPAGPIYRLQTLHCCTTNFTPQYCLSRCCAGPPYKYFFYKL